MCHDSLACFIALPPVWLLAFVLTPSKVTTLVLTSVPKPLDAGVQGAAQRGAGGGGEGAAVHRRGPAQRLPEGASSLLSLGHHTLKMLPGSMRVACAAAGDPKACRTLSSERRHFRSRGSAAMTSDLTNCSIHLHPSTRLIHHTTLSLATSSHVAAWAGRSTSHASQPAGGSPGTVLHQCQPRTDMV